METSQDGAGRTPAVPLDATAVAQLLRDMDDAPAAVHAARTMLWGAYEAGEEVTAA